MTDKTYLSVAETAKLLRGALKTTFPGVKFSVRSKSYSGGASIDVSWTDGPTGHEVRAVTDSYSGAGFDGMIDLKYYHSHWLLPDGTTVLASTYGHSYDNGTAVPEPPVTGAKKVHFGADFIFTSRHVSPALARKAVAELVTTYGLPFDPETAIEVSKYDGHALLSNEAGNFRLPDWNEWFSSKYHRALTGLRGDGTRTHDVRGFEIRDAA